MANSNDFFQLPKNERKQFRSEYFKENANKFIIGNINRNQIRKDIPTTIFSFIEYKETYNKDAFLYLHMDRKDPHGYDLDKILSQTNLKEHVDYQIANFKDNEFDTETLNKIYNSIDVYLTTATGGGWELTVTEAMSCLIPIIAPKHTSFKTLGGLKSDQIIFVDETE